MDLLAGLDLGTADALEPRAGIVRNLLLGEDAAVDLVCHLGQGRQLFKTCRQTVVGGVLPLLLSISLDARYVVQQGGNLEQLQDGEGAADFQRLQGKAQVAVVAEGRAARPKKALQGIPGLRLVPADLLRIRGGKQLQTELLSGFRIRFFRQHVDYFVIFQGL